MSSGLSSGSTGFALGRGLYKAVVGLWSGASGLVAGFGGGVPFGGLALYLEGGTNRLLLEGDAQSGTDVLLLEGST